MWQACVEATLHLLDAQLIALDLLQYVVGEDTFELPHPALKVPVS